VLHVTEDAAKRAAEHAEVRLSRDNMVFQIEELQQRLLGHRRQADEGKSHAR
jgi:hypothetical protein